MIKWFWKQLKKTRRILLYRIMRLKTVGVRVVLIENNRVLLIRHPYDSYWVFPGGGVKKNESPQQAAVRETLEETNYIIQTSNDLQQFGIYENNWGGKSDTVFLFICRKFSKSNRRKSLFGRIEVAEQNLFPLGQLPKISPATERRLSEIKKTAARNIANPQSTNTKALKW